MKNIFHKIFSNFFAKILCLLLAATLWLYVGIGQTKNNNFPGGVPLQLRNVPQGLVAVTDVDKVTVQVVAEADVFKNLNADSFAAYLDLAAYSEGTYDIKVTATTTVANVQIVATDPATVTVRLEPKAEKEVPVSCLYDGEAGVGLAPGQCAINPTLVKVAGARSVVNVLTEATVEIHLQGETADFKKEVKVVSLDAKGKEIKSLFFTPENVLVTVPIVKASNIKTVGVKVKVTGAPAEGFWLSKLESDPSTVTVTAAENTIGQVNFVETEPIDVSGLNRNQTTEVSLKPGPGVILMDKIDKVTVTLTVSKNQSTREIEAGFKWQNLADNLQVVLVEPNVVKVVAAGTQDQLQTLVSGDILIAVDLTSCDKPGTCSIDISRANIAGPTGISVSSIVPSAINVRLDIK